MANSRSEAFSNAESPKTRVGSNRAALESAGYAYYARVFTPLVFGLVLLLALLVIWQYDPPRRKVDGDASFMLYTGQQILRGNAPYKTVGIVKLPFSPFLAAAGIAAGRAFGLDDVFGGRYIFVVGAALAVGAVFLVGKQLGGNLLGVLSAFVLIGFQTLSIHTAKGPEAKIPLIAAGMFCVWLIAKRKWFWAGLAGACAFLTWQPGLIFVVCALLAPLLETRAKRWRALGLGSAGIVVPLLLVGVYLYANDALTPMWRHTFGANANYFQERKAATGLVNVVVSNVTRLWVVTNKCAGTESAFLPLGWLGLLGGGAFVLYRAGKMISSARVRAFEESQRQFLLNTLPLLLSGGALVGFSLLDVQSCMDFVPLLPYFAIGAALVIFAGVISIARLVTRERPLRRARVSGILGIAAALLVLAYGIQDALLQKPQNGLAQQYKLTQKISESLAPADTVQQFGDATFFVLSKRQNATHFIHLGEKQGHGILDAEGITINGLIQELETVNPRLMLISRGRAKGWAKPLFDWIAQNYTRGATYRKNQGSARAATDLWWRQE